MTLQRVSLLSSLRRAAMPASWRDAATTVSICDADAFLSIQATGRPYITLHSEESGAVAKTGWLCYHVPDLPPETVGGDCPASGEVGVRGQ
jgi:hypothetical protein